LRPISSDAPVAPGDHAPQGVASGSACGKVILLGEHAVVYGQPAIAAPVTGMRAEARVCPGRKGGGVTITAGDLGVRFGAGCDDERGLGLLLAARVAIEAFCPAPPAPDTEIHLRSAIPVARGMGSSAAVSAAIVRALAAYLSVDLTDDTLSRLVYQAEMHYHGTLSGIDNTVVSYERPVWFERGRPPEFMAVGAGLELLVADTGTPSRTRDTVAQVRAWRERDAATVDGLMAEIGALVRAARQQLDRGDIAGLGEAMSANQTLLRRLGVSTPALDALVSAAEEAGALGAKLCGGGGGGCAVALLAPGAAETVAAALRRAGAAALYVTSVGAAACVAG
jgi:mevalonate kinase